MRWQGQRAAIRCGGRRRRIRTGKCGDHAVKAVRFHEYGGIDVLRVEEVARPVPGPGIGKTTGARRPG